MSLPQAIKTLLQGVDGVINASVTYGKRNQAGSLPAVTYTVNRNDRMTIGANPMYLAEIVIRCTALEAQDAQQLGEDIEDEFVEGTYNDIRIVGIVNKNTVLNEPDSGFGDETVPFTATTTAEIYYTYT